MNYLCRKSLSFHLGHCVYIAVYTFIRAGNRSRCVKYDNSPVWKAPQAMHNATCMAFRRTSTVVAPCQNLTPYSCQERFVPARPVLICASKLTTKSVNIESTLSSPVNWEMMSELRFVYRFDSTSRRKIFNVYPMSISSQYNMRPKKKSNPETLTSNAISSDGLTPALTQLTARQNNCLVCG